VLDKLACALKARQTPGQHLVRGQGKKPPQPHPAHKPHPQSFRTMRVAAAKVVAQLCRNNERRLEGYKRQDHKTPGMHMHPDTQGRQDRKITAACMHAHMPNSGRTTTSQKQD